MSLEKIGAALSALRGAGISAQRRFSGELQPEIREPLAAVGLHKQTAVETVLTVEVFGPLALGGAACEDTAMRAAQVLTDLGAECTQEGCRFERSAGLFAVQVLANWKKEEAVPELPEEPEVTPEPEPEIEALGCSITIDGVAQPYITGFAAVQNARMQPVKAIEAGIVELRREDVCWVLTLEELLPLEVMPEEPKTFDFILRVRRSSGTEVYRYCYWEKVSRKDTPQGLRQVRIARSYAERQVE